MSRRTTPRQAPTEAEFGKGVLMKNDYCQQGYADFLLSQKWDYFFTVTSRTPRKDNLAFIRDVSNLILGEWNEADAKSFIAIEPHKLGGIHAHGLYSSHMGSSREKLSSLYEVSSNPKLQEGYRVQREVYGTMSELHRSVVESDCRRVFGFSRVSHIRSPVSVSQYCAKYVLKEECQNYEYDFLGNWR